MIKLDNGKYIIGFDNGYQFGKTANFMFDNGVYPLGKVEPSVREHSLKFERKYYKVTEDKITILRWENNRYELQSKNTKHYWTILIKNTIVS